jgi:transposase
MTVKTLTELKQIREHLRSLITSGNGDEALEMAVAILAELLTQNSELALRLAKLQREHSGRRSEKIDPQQLAMMLDLAEAAGPDFNETAEDDKWLEKELAEAELPPAPRLRPRRHRPSKQLPRDVIVHDLDAADRQCGSCGEEMTRIGEDVSEVVELVPSHFRVQEHRRAKYACGRCKETVKTAAGPDKLIDKGLAGPGLLAHVVVSKFQDHVPLTRLQGIYNRGGFKTSVSTLCGWVAGVAKEVEPITDRIWEKALGSRQLQADGSGLKVLDRDDPEGIRRGTMWCHVGDRKYVVFKYAPTGAGDDGPWEHLKGRRGYLQADASNIFDRLYDGQKAEATEVGCWAHSRRKYNDIKDGDIRAAYGLKLISQLYRVETLADRRMLTPDQRQELRSERSRRIAQRLKNWAVQTMAAEPPESALHKACAYTINQWIPLTRFLDDGVLPLGRVGHWRGGRGGLANPGCFSPFGRVSRSSGPSPPFPAPSHRTGRAAFPHPALGQEITPSLSTRRGGSPAACRGRAPRGDTRTDTGGIRCPAACASASTTA